MKIVVKDIVHTFPSNINETFDAISNVSLIFNQNEFISIIGPTGSGKTTLIEHFNSLLIPTKGSIEFTFDYSSKDKKTQKEIIESKTIEVKKRFRKIKNVNEIRKRVGVVFQFAEYQLFEETIEKDIIFGPMNMGVPKDKAKEIAKEIIVKVGLDETFLSRSPFELSGGQKRRVAIAGILSMMPDVLIFDEPTAGLDPEGAKEMLELFESLHKEGKTIIIVTHNLDDALEFTKRTIFLKEGKLIKDAETLSILSDEQFLVSNNMYVPKLISLTNNLNKMYGTNLPYTRSVDEFVAMINKIKEGMK